MRRVSLLLLMLAPCGLFAQVSYERLVRAESESENWLTYSGSYWSQRFSTLKQITAENVAKLKPAWVYQIREPGIMSRRVFLQHTAAGATLLAWPRQARADADDLGPVRAQVEKRHEEDTEDRE